MSLGKPVSVKRDCLYGLESVILNLSEFQTFHLFCLRGVNKQWRSSITARMMADALQRELPMLVGFPLDKPLDFYVDIARSYYSKCKEPRFVVDFLIGKYATQNFHQSLQCLNFRSDRPTVWAHLLITELNDVLHTFEGRAFVLESVVAWQSAARSRLVCFHRSTDDFLNILERIVRSAFVIIGRRVTTGAIGYGGSMSFVDMIPRYSDVDFD